MAEDRERYRTTDALRGRHASQTVFDELPGMLTGVKRSGGHTEVVARGATPSNRERFLGNRGRIPGMRGAYPCSLLTLALAAGACKTRDNTSASALPSSAPARDAATVLALVDGGPEPSGPAEGGAPPAVDRIPPRLLPVEGGTFRAALFEGATMRAVRVQALAPSVIAPDQRAGASIERGEEVSGFELPLSQLGTFQENGVRRLALVEARPRPTVPLQEKPDLDPVDCGLVAWFVAKAEHRLRPKGGEPLVWRTWQGESLPAVYPDVLTIEDARGRVVAARFLGAQNGVRTLDVDAATPMFVASILENGSGVDDAITLSVIAFVEGELRQLLAVNAGPRSQMSCTAKRCDVLGPVGSVALVRDDGAPALRVRRVVEATEEPCTPGAVSDPGCKGEELAFRWDSAAKRFAAGPATSMLLQQTAPGSPVTVRPTTR